MNQSPPYRRDHWLQASGAIIGSYKQAISRRALHRFHTDGSNVPSSRKSPPRKRPGVILVLVLLMLTLCASIAAQVASRTIRLSGQAADSQRELQSRWAIVSIRRSILNEARSLLTATNTEPPSSKAIANRETVLVLGGIRYQLILQDESAKAPISRMLQAKNQQQVKPILRQLLNGRAILQSNIPAKPTQWREIVDLPDSDSSIRSFENLFAITQNMTLWSEGRLNVMTAEKETIDALWRFQFNSPAPESITNLHQTEPAIELTTANAQSLDLSVSQSEFAANWLTTTSSSYSLWIVQTKPNSNGQAILYVRRSQTGYAEEHFGFHTP